MESLQNKKPNLILDTNVISYASNYPAELQDQVLKIIENYRSKYEPVITDYIQFELLKKAEDKDSALLKKLKLFGKLKTTEDIVLIAGLLCGVYKKAKTTLADDGDLIIASTAYVSQSFLLTANQKDFPYPFFEERECIPISFKEYENSHRTKIIALYLLEPNQTKTSSEIHKFFN